MPRKARIDLPGAIHHVIIRGIEKKAIFRDNHDKDDFIKRLGNLLLETSTPCYAWALMPNHVHLLLRTGTTPIATLMRRLLTGYALYFNRRYHRHGPLFQNRYKSILCEEDAYLLQLVRYIHLNPLRVGLVKNLSELLSYQYGGHAVLMGHRRYAWQDRDYILNLFGRTEKVGQRIYGSFVADGVQQGRRPDLTGGGLLRSLGGWAELKTKRSSGMRIKGDERILGSTAFVEKVMKNAQEEFERQTYLKRRGLTWDGLLEKVVNYFKVDVENIKAGVKERNIVKIRSFLCYVAVRKLRMTATAVALRLNITPSAVSKLVLRGQTIWGQTGVEREILKS